MLRSFLISLVILTAAPVFAQAPGQTPPIGGTHGPRAQTPKETKRDKVKKRIRALRAYTLIEELPLDDATAGKLLPVMARYDDDFDKLLQAHADLQRRLDGAGDLKDARAIDRLIDEAVTNQRAFWDLEDKRLAEMRKILTPAQVARLLIVLPALERRIQNQLRNAIKPKAKRQAVDGDDDDDLEPGEKPVRPQPTPPPKGRNKDLGCNPFDSLHGCR